MMRASRPRLVAAALTLVASAVLAAGCGGDDDETTSSTGGTPDLGLIEEGTLSVGTDTPFAPFEIGQPPDITGYDIEVMNAIAEQIGVEASYTDTSFDTIFRDTASGQFDIAAAASTITPGRQQLVSFSDPYYDGQQALVVAEGSDIASVDDLADTIVGAQDATTGETYANDETEASEVRGFPEGPDAISAVITGQVDAAIIDLPVATGAVEKQGGIVVVEEITTNELYGFAMAKENTELVSAVNEALATIKEDGTLDELYMKYFSIEAPPTVLEGTTENPG